MHTPAHIAASLILWRRSEKSSEISAVVLGAVTPDSPMYLFYAAVKLSGYSEKKIWNELYFLPEWQLLIDLFNSFLVYGFLALAAYQLRRRLLWLFSASALLHLACDLPLHHDDAHRHFLPLSQWRLESPISYWDPAHHGIPVAIAEACLAIGACVWLTRNSPNRLSRQICWFLLALYGLAAALLIVLAATRLFSG